MAFCLQPGSMPCPPGTSGSRALITLWPEDPRPPQWQCCRGAPMRPGRRPPTVALHMSMTLSTLTGSKSSCTPTPCCSMAT